jgi:hypothetical protein
MHGIPDRDGIPDGVAVEGLFDSTKFHLMKETAVFVNVGGSPVTPLPVMRHTPYGVSYREGGVAGLCAMDTGRGATTVLSDLDSVSERANERFFVR